MLFIQDAAHKDERPLPIEGAAADSARRVPFARITGIRFEGSRAAPGSQESSPHGDDSEYSTARIDLPGAEWYLVRHLSRARSLPWG
jgi:hypothetical protein